MTTQSRRRDGAMARRILSVGLSVIALHWVALVAQAPPARIVSLVPAATEMLFAIGTGFQKAQARRTGSTQRDGKLEEPLHRAIGLVDQQGRKLVEGRRFGCKVRRFSRTCRKFTADQHIGRPERDDIGGAFAGHRVILSAAGWFDHRELSFSRCRIGRSRLNEAESNSGTPVRR